MKRSAFRWLSGADAVATFESSPGNRRGFCRHCGCVAPIETAYGAVRVRATSLNYRDLLLVRTISWIGIIGYFAGHEFWELFAVWINV